MIIDTILDRKDGCDYDTDKFCEYCNKALCNEQYSFTKAIYDGDEEKVKSELCRYIDEQGYNPDIKNYINSVQWTKILSNYEKYNYLVNYVVNEQFCIWDLFVDNVGGERKIKAALENIHTRKGIRKYVNQFI